MSGFATGLRPFSRGSAMGESDPDTYLITFAAADTGTVNVAASGSIVNTGTGSVPWSITPPSGVTVTPSSGLSIAGTTTPLSIVATAAATYSLSVTAAGATITGNSQSIVVTSSAPTIATLSGSATATATVAETYTATLNAAADQTYTITPSASDSATLSAATVTITAGNTSGTFTATWPAAGAGRTVDFTISPTLTRAGRPLTVGVSVLTVGAQIATLAVVSESGSGTRPYAATVMPPRGAVPNGQHLANQAGTEAGAILSRYDDDSAALVVFASIASAAGNVALHVATGTAPAALTAVAIAAAGLTSVSVDLGAYGVAGITDFSSPAVVWYATSKVYCASFRVAAPSPGSTALEAVVYVRAYADRAFVRVVVENAKLNVSAPVSPAAASYTGAVVTVNGSAVATVNGNGAPEGAHSALRAWQASTWVGAGAPGLRVTQLHTELQQHPLLWKMAAASSSDLSTYAADAYTPWGTGRHRASNMGAGGDHASIGPLSQWEARALQGGDYRAWNATEASALAVLGFGVNYRDAATGLVPTLAQVSGRSMQISEGTAGHWPGNAYSNSAMGWEVAHHPAVGLMAFIANPDPVYIELAQKVALWNGTWSQYADAGPAYSTGVFGTVYQVRARAWGMRSLAHATFLTPTGHAWKSAGQDSLAANVANFDGYRTDSKQTALATFWENRIGNPKASHAHTTRVNFQFWMYHWVIAEVAKIAAARVVKTADQAAIDTLADWMCSHPVKWFNDQAATGAWRYVPENIVLGTDVQSAPAMTNASDFATQRATWMTDSPPSTVAGPWKSPTSDSADNYATPWTDDTAAGVSRASSLWTALVVAVDRGVSGAATAWNLVQSNVTNLSTWLTGFGSDPRSGATPKNPPPPTGFASGTDAGTLVGDVWTPARTAGVVNAASWAIVPTGRWVSIAGTGLAASLDATVRAGAPSWSTSQLAWPSVLNAYNGFAIDLDGCRVWLQAAGGHADSANNGVYAFEAFKMAWSVERLPSDRSLWTSAYGTGSVPASGSWTSCTPSNTEYLAQAPAAGTANAWYWDEIYWDNPAIRVGADGVGTPTSRHVYSSAVYDPVRNHLVQLCRRLWKFDLSTKTWVYKRTTPLAVDGALIASTYDEVTQEYLFTAIGDGIGRNYSYNLSTDTFSSFSPPWGGRSGADTRHGRYWAFLEPPFHDSTAVGNYYRLDLDTRSTGGVQGAVQFGGGLTRADFRGITSPGYDGGVGMCYVPSLNRYWVTLNMAAGVRWIEMDPTTSGGWTLSPLTFANAAPPTLDKPERKVIYFPTLNAVLFFSDSTQTGYIYKF